MAKSLRLAEKSGPARVDVLVAYDRRAMLWAGLKGGGVTNFAAEAVARMNVAVNNSGLRTAIVFRLAGVCCVPEDGGADFDWVLDCVTFGHGAWAAVPKARDRLGADITMTMIDTGISSGTTGLSWALDRTDYESFADFAFGVCAVRAVAESHTMTHEVGHLFGAGHSDRQHPAYDPGPLLFPYSSGYYFETNGVPCRTIMAYDDDGYGRMYEEVPYFSSPEISLAGVALGASLNDNARTLRETAAAVANFRSSPEKCVHDPLVVSWNPGSGRTCEYGEDGDVWQWCPDCEKWFLTASLFDSSAVTYVLCHGHANSLDELWLRDMARALPSTANVLAVNWGEAADQTLPHLSAASIPAVVQQAEEELVSDFKINPSLTTLIGHSHGAHVAANIVYDLGSVIPFSRFVGLETSTDDFGVHELNYHLIRGSYGPDRWRGDIKRRCTQVEFYKTSWIMSLSREKAYGHYDFVVVGKDGMPESLMGVARIQSSLTNVEEIARHSYAHEWFTATIEDPASYASVGFNFKGDSALQGSAGFCGLIRDNVLYAPMGCFVSFDCGEGDYPSIPLKYYDYDRVYALPTPTVRGAGGSAFGSWLSSKGRLYDNGMLIFNLGKDGETIDMFWGDAE